MRNAFLSVLLLACACRFAVAANCTISSTAIAFGNYSGTAVPVTGTITVNCNPNTKYTIGLSAGNSGGTDSNRSMTGPALLPYGLYSDASYSVNWGNTTGTGAVSGTGDGTAQKITVFALIAANHYPQPSTAYSDTITATISGSNFSTVTTTFTVKATVLDACIISAADLAFGTYSGTQIDSTSNITVTCTNTTRYQVGLNAGTASGATVADRSMVGPASKKLHYKLLSDPARFVNWGNTVGADTVPGAGTGIAQTLTVYGRLPANQFVQPGNYSDTITATITY